LVRVNSIKFLHIVLFCIGLSFNSYAETRTIVFQNTTDSLQIDNSTITPRYFENLQDKYSDEDFIYERTVENSGWWSRFKQWLSDFFKRLFNLTNEGQASNATDIAIKTAGVILFLLVIYFIFRAVVNKEGTWVFGQSSDKNIIPVTDIENNIHSTNFKALISEAESNNNYRLAIRYYYLWLLKQLTQEALIEYDVEKTNSDYKNEIVSKAIKEEFSYTSYLYNYIWYGEFDVNKEQFNKAKHAFINFLKTINA
jgi:hypothetical protein